MSTESPSNAKKPSLLDWFKQNVVPLGIAVLVFGLTKLRLFPYEVTLPDGTKVIEHGFNLYQQAGSVIYGILAVSIFVPLARLVIHLRFKHIDGDSFSGRKGRDWDQLTPAERTWNTTITTIGIWISIAIVFATCGR